MRITIEIDTIEKWLLDAAIESEIADHKEQRDGNSDNPRAARYYHERMIEYETIQRKLDSAWKGQEAKELNQNIHKVKEAEG